MQEVRKQTSYQEFRTKRSGGLGSYKFASKEEPKEVVSAGGAFGKYKYAQEPKTEEDSFKPLGALIDALTNLKL